MKGERVIGSQRVALVTGGSSGIGLAVARLLARNGCHIWLLARNPDRLNEALSVLEKERASADQRFYSMETDVSSQEQVFAALERVRRESGTPHLVINSAGQVLPGYVEEIDLEIFRQLMEVNYFGCVYTTKAVLPDMLERGWGHIVFISSLGGLISGFGYTAYCPSKFALHGFADALRQEMKPRGIRVSIVCPSDTDTPQLAYENRFKPVETLALASNAGVASPESVAAQILNGVTRGKYLIIPGGEGKFFYFLKRMLGAGFDFGMDWIIARARRNDHSRYNERR
jgi:3-dehydrosphinganine reductase